MTKPSNNTHSTLLQKCVTLLLVLLAVTALVFTYLAPGFSLDNGVVYGAF